MTLIPSLFWCKSRTSSIVFKHSAFTKMMISSSSIVLASKMSLKILELEQLQHLPVFQWSSPPFSWFCKSLQKEYLKIAFFTVLCRSLIKKLVTSREMVYTCVSAKSETIFQNHFWCIQALSPQLHLIRLDDYCTKWYGEHFITSIISRLILLMLVI